MALINCPECDAEISDNANACVKCGNPIQKYDLSQNSNSSVKKQEKEIAAWKVILIGLILGGGGSIAMLLIPKSNGIRILFEIFQIIGIIIFMGGIYNWWDKFKYKI
jgi:hypothetical protein